MSNVNSQPCVMCGRVTRRGNTRHHLIPRTCHKNRWFKKRFTHDEMNTTIDVCHDCHVCIHRVVPREKDLGRHYNTLELLLAHPEIGKFVQWVASQR